MIMIVYVCACGHTHTYIQCKYTFTERQIWRVCSLLKYRQKLEMETKSGSLSKCFLDNFSERGTLLIIHNKFCLLSLGEHGQHYPACENSCWKPFAFVKCEKSGKPASVISQGLLHAGAEDTSLKAKATSTSLFIYLFLGVGVGRGGLDFRTLVAFYDFSFAGFSTDTKNF